MELNRLQQIIDRFARPYGDVDGYDVACIINTVLEDVADIIDKQKKPISDDYTCTCDYGSCCDNCKSKQYNTAVKDSKDIINSLKVSI